MLTTGQLANKLRMKPGTLRCSLVKNGEYLGVKPVRLPNRFLAWPDDAVRRMLHPDDRERYDETTVLITTESLAEKLHVRPNSIRESVCIKGHYLGISPFRLQNRMLRWSVEDVENVIGDTDGLVQKPRFNFGQSTVEGKTMLTTEQFAEKLHVKPNTIRSALCRTGSYMGIRPVKLPNGKLQWSTQEIDRLKLEYSNY